MPEHPGHCVAVFGGAVSGAEACHQLAQRGIHTVLFEQNYLPYGKIEDGLPKWHVKLRDKEESKINDKLDNEYIHFVPGVKLGQDIDFDEVVNNWGFSAVLLAVGAWRDRPLPVDGIDAYVDKGLYYQNPFFMWYNHFHEDGFKGKQFDITDDVIVLGGGLASIDVCKAAMMELVEKALKERGIETNMFDFEKKGIASKFEELDLTLDDLGIKGCTLYYRRRNIDMPLASVATDTTELLEKAQNTRAKILNNAMRKFLFKFKECYSPVEKIVEGDRLVGLGFRENEVVDGKLTPKENSYVEVKCSLVISSIGSLPEMIPGIANDGQTFTIGDQDMCRLDGYDNVFALGNAVTGRGNIKESYQHGHEISQRMMDQYLDWQEQDFHNLLSSKEEGAIINADVVAEISKKNLQDYSKIYEMKVTEFWNKVGYDGDYRKWIAKHTPKRLEEMLGIEH